MQSCLILHNMVIHFEEALGTSSTMPWAQQEYNNLDEGGENTVTSKTIAMPNPNTAREVHCNHLWELHLALVGTNNIQALCMFLWAHRVSYSMQI